MQYYAIMRLPEKLFHIFSTEFLENFMPNFSTAYSYVLFPKHGRFFQFFNHKLLNRHGRKQDSLGSKILKKSKERISLREFNQMFPTPHVQYLLSLFPSNKADRIFSAM